MRPSFVLLAGSVLSGILGCGGPQVTPVTHSSRPCQTVVNVQPRRATLVITGASVPSLAVRPLATDWTWCENMRARLESLRAAADDPGLTDAERAGHAEALERSLTMERKGCLGKSELEPAPDAPPTSHPAYFELTSSSISSDSALVDMQGVVRWRFRLVAGHQLGVSSEPPAEQPPRREYGHGPQAPFIATAQLDGGLTATISIEPAVSISECHG